MNYGEKKLDRPIRVGMVGGGRGGQIGYIHRMAATRDFNFQLIAGAFDVNPERGRDFGINLHIDPSRLYDDYKEMFAKEKERDDGIEAVIIATPNYLHYEITKAALENDLHVVCEKPMTFTVKEAEDLKELSEKHKKILATTFAYSGYQMIEQARQMVKHGDLGNIRVINMVYAHGYHNVAVEKHNASTKWRVDPKMAGPSYVLGDIGIHVLYLSRIICPELKIKKLMCSRQSFVKSRAPLEDNAMTIQKYNNGAVGYLWSSCVNSGSMYGMKIRIVGEKASIEWHEDHPYALSYEVQGEPQKIMVKGADYLYPEAREDDRGATDVVEGLFESWANLYSRFAQAMYAIDHGETYDKWYPNVNDGLEAVRWIENCVKSADNGASWIDYK